MKGSSIFDVFAEMEFYVFIGFVILLGALAKYLPPSLYQYDFSGTFRDFWLLLPDYAVIVMLRAFSFSFVLSIILIVVIIWTSNRILRIRRKMQEDLNPAKSTNTNSDVVPTEIVNEKWQKVIIHINSDNSSDWKLAILECDIMLGDILEKMGYMQESIGEKLKAVEPSDFTNIESAWEAHKIRNAVAHEGSEFMIDHREAKRVIGLYEVVFREFAYI